MKHFNYCSNKVQTTFFSIFILGSVFVLNSEKGFTQYSKNSFSFKCPDLKKCIQSTSELTNDKYIFDNNISGKASSSENTDLTRDNANLLLTKALHLNGYTRVPLNEPSTYQVMLQKDARDTLLPKVTSSFNTAPELPNTWDLYFMTYQAKNSNRLEQMARVARSFLSENSRIVPIEMSNQIIITAPIPELKNVYEIIRDIDQKSNSDFSEKIPPTKPIK